MLFALLLLSFKCLVTINVLWLFLMVPWVDCGITYICSVTEAHSICRVSALEDISEIRNRKY